MSILYVGDDWAEDHHDVCLMDETGQRVAGGRLPEGLTGVARLHEMIAARSLDDSSEVVVGIETDRGLWVNAMVASGYQVYAINPLSVARYRDRYQVSGAKSDTADAKLLADLVRTDRHNHRMLAADSADVESIKVLARAHQNLVWARTRHSNQLRSALREYYPAAVAAFERLGDRDALAVLGRAPTPEQGAKLSISQIRAALKRGGRQRNLDTRAAEIKAALRSDQLCQPAAITAGFAISATALVAILVTMNQQINVLSEELTTAYEQHEDSAIYRSLPGLSGVTGAKILAEFGDDPDRYATAKARKNYAGTSPVTIASGKKRAVLARHVRNRRLADAIDQWAFTAISTSAGSRAFYDEHRDQGNSHHQALRALGNRLVGLLHGCLRHQVTYDEDIAWAHRRPQIQAAA